MGTSIPALGPIPAGLMVWLGFLFLTIGLILLERTGGGTVSITNRVLAFTCGVVTFVLGIAPIDYVIVYQNGTLASQNTSLVSSGTGIAGTAIFIFVSALLAFTMLQILEILITVMNQKRVND